MRSHQKPRIKFKVDLQAEIAALDNHKAHRNIPDKVRNKILIATWNLTNFGLQKRQNKHLKLIAKICSFFDIIAVQEVADDLKDFEKVMKYLGSDYSYLLTDIAGNQERLGYIYDKNKISPTGMTAELAMRGYERKSISIQIGDELETETFDGFNRNPYFIHFQSRVIRIHPSECPLVLV